MLRSRRHRRPPGIRNDGHCCVGGSLGAGEAELSGDGIPDVLTGARRVLAEVAQVGEVDGLPEGFDLGGTLGTTGDMGVDGIAQAFAEGK
jgi:hypothetical protein